MSDDTASATKADLKDLAKEMRQGFERLREADDQILSVLIHVEKRLTHKVDDHERRITTLENIAA